MSLEFVFLIVFLGMVALIAMVIKRNETAREKAERRHNAVVANLLDRLAYATGHPVFPRNDLPTPGTELTPVKEEQEEGWHQL